MVVDRPIIFSAPMVLALLREAVEPGTGKSQTRRLLYTVRKAKGDLIPASATIMQGHPPPRGHAIGEYYALSGWQRAKPGDRLWVRENLRHDGHAWCYGADGKVTHVVDMARALNPAKHKSVPSIHMPRWASRLTLVVTGTKIERLQDISEQDCEREGLIYWTNVPPGAWGVRVDGGYAHVGLTAQESFMNLFCAINGPNVWRDNPEVVAVSFKVLQTNVDMLKAA